MSLGQAMLEVARTQIGVHESGNNRGPRVKVFQDFIGHSLEGQPWCAAFTSWCLYQAANKTRIKPQMPPMASSQGIYEWARMHGKLAHRPSSGMIGLLREGGHYGHTFMVESVHGGEVTGIDGNWGDRVARTSHPIGSCAFVEV